MSEIKGKEVNKFKEAFYVLAGASSGNPVLAVATIMLFYVMFNLLLAQLEKLIFGERFEHFLDPVFALFFIASSAYSVWWCAIYNSEQR